MRRDDSSAVTSKIERSRHKQGDLRRSQGLFAYHIRTDT